jgi:hypothetical protein
MGQTTPVVTPGRSFSGSPGVHSFAGSAGVRSFAGSPVIHSQIARSPRTVIISPGFGFSPFGLGYPGLYSPYYSPFSAPYFFSDPYSTGQAYAAPGYSYSEPAYAPQEAPAPVASQSDSDLAYQVGRLSAEVEQLRQQQQVQAQPAAPSVATPTVLIFKDGHHMEIQNYAIVGQTLWVLDDRNSSKISLTDLDIDATQKENRARGLRFVPPSSSR